MIRIEINDDAVTAALARLNAAVSDMSEPMNRIGAALVRSSKDRIDAGVSPDGAAFAPRSPATLDAYASRKPPAVPRGGPLKLTGEMQSQIFHEYGPDWAEVGSNAIQAAVMQFGAAKGAFGQAANGSAIPWGAIPARPFLGVSEEDVSDIAEIVEEWIARAAGG